MNPSWSGRPCLDAERGEVLAPSLRTYFSCFKGLETVLETCSRSSPVNGNPAANNSLLYRPSPTGFRMSPKTETPQHLWETCATAVSLTVKKCLFVFRFNFFFFFSLCPLHLLGEKIVSPSSSFRLSDQVFMHVDKIPWSLLFSKLNSPSCLSLCSYERCSIRVTL